MHLEILVEDSSGGVLLQILLPKILDQGEHTWRVHAYKGIGRIPKGLKPSADPSKRILLDRLPKLLQGYSKTPGIDAVVVVIDNDSRDCRAFLKELQQTAAACNPAPRVLFRLAIEEMEAWLLGDPAALRRAYPKLKSQPLGRYQQDAICGTWELLADVVYQGGSATIVKQGWPLSGRAKHEWAQQIGPYMDVERNKSGSFAKFRDGLRAIVGLA